MGLFVCKEKMEVEKRRKDKLKKKKRKRKYLSSTDDSSSSSSERSAKRSKKSKKHKKKEVENLKKSKKSECAEEEVVKECTSSSRSEEIVKKKMKKERKKSPEVDPRSIAMQPMTPAEWAARQSVVRRVYDEETGRSRLVRGDGEILEECVSRQCHLEINKKATQSDGLYFQAKLGLLK